MLAFVLLLIYLLFAMAVVFITLILCYKKADKDELDYYLNSYNKYKEETKYGNNRN